MTAFLGTLLYEVFGHVRESIKCSHSLFVQNVVYSFNGLLLHESLTDLTRQI